MRVFARGLRVGACVALLTLLAACHQAGEYKLRFVNQSDNKKVLEMSLPTFGFLVRVHNSVFPGGRPKGNYTLRDGEKTFEGRVKQDSEGYLLYPADGPTQRMSVSDVDGVLKDESGATWKLDNPSTTASLKQW